MHHFSSRALRKITPFLILSLPILVMLQGGESLTATVEIGDEVASYTYSYGDTLSLPLSFPERMTDRVSLTLKTSDELLITETQWIERR